MFDLATPCVQVQRNTQEQEIRRLRAALVRKEQEASRARHQLEDVEARAAAAASAPATGRHAIRPSAIKATPAATREAKLVRRCGVLQDMVDRLQREVEELRKSSAAADEAQQQALVYATEIRRLRAQLQQQQTAGSSPRRRPRPSSAQSRRTASSSAYLAPQPMQALEDRETISSNNNTTHMVKLHARLQAVQEREAELQHQIEEAQRVVRTRCGVRCTTQQLTSVALLVLSRCLHGQHPSVLRGQPRHREREHGCGRRHGCPPSA